MVYIEYRSVIDARPGGVRSANTQRLFFDADLPVYALRLRTPPSPAQLRTIEAELRSKTGARYSALEAVRAVLPGQRRASRRSDEHTSELQSLMRISYAGFCWQKK